MNRQVVYDAMHLKVSEFSRVQEALGVTFHRGVHEKEVDFRTRVLQEIDNRGNMRTLEQLLTE
ncbi:hypothetical protein D3C85_527450 [compost metagenome]